MEERERPDDDASALTTLWQERGVLPFVDGDGSQSLAASDRALVSGLTRSAGGARLDDATRASLAREQIELHEPLGRGGMGIVLRATQRSLRRDVAVKRLTEDANGPRSRACSRKRGWVVC